MKPIAIVTCAACAVGLWSCAAVASDAGRRRSRAVELPSLDEMVRVVEAQRYLTSAASDLIGSVTSGKVFDFYGFSAGYDDPTVAGECLTRADGYGVLDVELAVQQTYFHPNVIIDVEMRR